MKINKVMIAVMAVVLALPLGRAQSPVAGRSDSLLKQELRQKRITVTTGDSARLLAELVDEFERNGLEGKDVEVLGVQDVGDAGSVPAAGGRAEQQLAILALRLEMASVYMRLAGG